MMKDFEMTDDNKLRAALNGKIKLTNEEINELLDKKKLLKRKGERRERDFYQTPEPIAKWTVDRCIELLITEPERFAFFEPGCGQFAPFLKRANELGMNARGIDIRDLGKVEIPNVIDKTDFFSNLFDGTKYHIIATNPPFNVAIPFWRRCMELVSDYGIVAMVIKQAMLGGKQRSMIWESRPPAEVHILYPRPSFTGDGNTDIGQEYCVAFWYGDRLNKAYNHRFGGTSLHWLNWKAL